MKTRNTKQKQVIMNTLTCNKNHPTIQELYEMITKEEGSAVGQATIYRNVSRMVEEGTIKKISTIDGTYRYDGDISDHLHLVCGKCGRLVDVFDPNISKVIAMLEKQNGIIVTNHNILLEGICPNCMKGSKNEEVSL